MKWSSQFNRQDQHNRILHPLGEVRGLLLSVRGALLCISAEGQVDAVLEQVKSKAFINYVELYFICTMH